MPDGVSDETARAADGTTTSSTAIAHPDSQRSPRHVDRSCTVCHRRKVRCDKRLPCAACIRGKHECSYDDPAGAGRPKRRRPRQTIADVASRISNLERSIVKGSSPASTRTTQRTSRSREENQGDVTPLTIHTPDTRDSDAANEVLIQNGPTSQYVDESVLSRMIEADSGKCALYATPPGPARAHAEASAFSLMGILSHPSSFRSEPEYVISRTNGMKLWHAFVQNVDPIVKILHIPTTEVEIFTAINQPGSVGKDTLALLYAIYFAAATSLEPDDISKMLDMTQLAALGKFRTHFQKALADTDALENPTVTLLQGLAIYLHIVPSWNSSRASWILNGLALRMALTIGLHTDGDKLGLPPFEAEVRRRVWWHLYARDFRALEDHGINPRLHLPVSSTRMPGNFDDSDLTPGMTELATPRRAWTRMTFQLVNIEVANAFHQTLPSMCAVFEPGQRMARRDELFEQLRARLAPYFASCHTVVPMQKFSFQIGQAIVHKMDLITRQQVANLETPDDRDSFATEENLDAACVCLEKNIDAWHDELLRPHKWSQRVHPQYFLVLYVLWHLCIRPDSPQASRAWGVVDAMFRVEQQRLANASSGQNVKRVVLERMRAKAEAVRPSTVAAPVNNGVNGTSNDATDAGFAQFSFGAGDLPPGQFYEDLNFDWSESLENMEMPNWNTLVNDLRGDQFSVPGMF